MIYNPYMLLNLRNKTQIYFSRQMCCGATSLKKHFKANPKSSVKKLSNKKVIRSTFNSTEMEYCRKQLMHII